jgi:hypothetical protein
MKHDRWYFLAILATTFISATASAQDNEIGIDPAIKRYVNDFTGTKYVAQNDITQTVQQFQNVQSPQPKDQGPWLTGNTIHEYLGLTTLGVALATALTAPGDQGNKTPNVNGTHAQLGRATRALALATVVTGLIFHWDDLHLFDDGLKDPDTQHWLLAGAGALILANAVSKAPNRSHSGQAEAGALAMLVGVKLVW